MANFIIEIHDLATGDYVGPGLGSSNLGDVLPRVGETIFAPLSKKDMGPPRNADLFYAWDIAHLYFLPPLEGGPIIIKALANKREPSEIERKLL